MKTRLKALRKQLKLTQDCFGQKLGVGKTSVSNIETGKNNLTEPMIRLICFAFNVNENWFRTGEGNMFIEPDTCSLDEYAKQHGCTPLDIDIIKAYIELIPSRRQVSVSNLQAVFSCISYHDIQETVRHIHRTSHKGTNSKKSK